MEFTDCCYIVPDAVVHIISERSIICWMKRRLRLVAEALYLGIVHDTVFQYSCAGLHVLTAANF